MDISTSSRPRPPVPHSSNALKLQGHSAEVCACTWSPVELLLASGSGDSTARIWGIADRTNSISLENRIGSVRVLKHAEGTPNEKKKEVATLEWNSDGTLLATGSHDGRARIWTTKGELTGTLSKHKGPIYSVKWNKKGDYLLTGSADQTAAVWDVKANEMKQQFKFHSGATLDVDWRSNSSFASCSSGAMIYVCKIGEDQPIKMFSGHKGEINSVKWDPSGLLLASCSDDRTAKIWSLKQDKHIYDLEDHAQVIYTIKWSPTGPATENPNKQLLLASASHDSTVKLWDVEYGRLISSLNGHRGAVFALCFSPNGEYLASGSKDKMMHIWSLKDGEIVKSYTSNGSIFDISWHKRGDKIAACSNKNLVSVLDFDM